MKDIANKLSVNVNCLFLLIIIILNCSTLQISAQDNPNVPAKTQNEAQAQQRPENVNNPIPDVSRESTSQRTVVSGLSDKECALAIMIIITTLICMSLIFFLLKKNPKLKAEDILRVFGVSLIIFGTLFIIVSGYSSEQIAPAMGLFGTIAGYVLGKTNKREVQKNA
jgi:hypothetical protein